MKKRINKIVALALTGAVIAGCITGCGGSNNPAETQAGKTEESKDDAGKEEADSGKAANAADASEIPYDEDLPADYAGTISMWGWDDAYFKATTKAFNEKYPNVKFEYTPMANGDSLQKYQTALAAGTNLPDVAWAIIDSRAKIYELDMWEDLSAAPYNFDINNVYEIVHPRMVNSKGQVCGIEQCLTPAGMAYRKDLTLEYLGTDDPKELEALLPDWETFEKVGKEVYEKSGGTIYMWPGIADAQQFIREQGAKSWIEGNTVNATDTLQRSIELACEFRDNKICDKLEAWSTAWYASYGEGKHMFNGCATWSIPFNIEPNDPTGEDGTHWGLMSAPEGNISWGGTAMGVTKTCKDKRLAWEFIKFATLSTEGAEALNTINFQTTAIKPYEEKPELKSSYSKWFGDQDVGKYFFDEIMPDIQARPMNQDDNVIHETLNLITTAINNDSSMTAEEAMKQLKEELEMRLPDYEIK